MRKLLWMEECGKDVKTGRQESRKKEGGRTFNTHSNYKNVIYIDLFFAGSYNL